MFHLAIIKKNAMFICPKYNSPIPKVILNEKLTNEYILNLNGFFKYQPLRERIMTFGILMIKRERERERKREKERNRERERKRDKERARKIDRDREREGERQRERERERMKERKRERESKYI